MLKAKIILFVFFITSFLSGFSQITLTKISPTAQELVTSILGPGVTVQNFTLSCKGEAIALFDNAVADVGIKDGVLLTTGTASYAVLPNSGSNPSGSTNSNSGDIDLTRSAKLLAPPTSTIPIATYDGCVIEFDFVSYCNSINIEYVFGSEEYPEYIGRQFSDVFGFFISGFNPTDPSKPYDRLNIATIPNSTVGISVNSINYKDNPNLFKFNYTPSASDPTLVSTYSNKPINYDGYTKPLKASVAIKPCEMYHLKIGIADVLDPSYDSGIFIKGKSLECAITANYTERATELSPIKNCTSGSYTFCRAGDLSIPWPVTYTIGGTALPGVDYEAIPTKSIVIPAGQKCLTTEVKPILGAVGDPTVQTRLTIDYSYYFCPVPDQLVINFKDLLPIDAGPDIEICSNTSKQMGLKGISNTTYTWAPSAGLDDVNKSNPSVTLPNLTSVPYTTQYTLTLQNSNTGNCVVTDTLNVTVNPLPTVVSVAEPGYCLGAPITLTTTGTSPNPGGTIVDWLWYFPNNGIDRNQNPKIVFLKPGIVTPTVNVTDEKGCKGTNTVEINVWPPPVADFSVTTACIGQPVDFTNLSATTTGVIQSSDWTFGDGEVSTDLSPSHQYTTGLTAYSVTLSVVNDQTCKNTIKKNVFLAPFPRADFIVNGKLCALDDVRFLNKSNADNSFWRFEPSVSTATSTIRNPTYKYSSTGTYSVFLRVKSNFGCEDSIEKTITLVEAPKIDFVATYTTGCPPFCTTFKADTLPGSSAVTEWMWDFGSQSTISGQKVDFCYKTSGTYSPAVIATSANGCKTKLTKDQYILVNKLPLPDFDFTPRDLSSDNSIVTITDESSSDVVDWLWDFGDNTTSVAGKNPPPHTYNIPDDATQDLKFLITLKVKNLGGCPSEISKTVYVKPEVSIYIPNAFTPNELEDNINSTFFPVFGGAYANSKFRMSIFDRWGNVIFKETGVNISWNGKFKGANCTNDVYTYLIEVYDKKEDKIFIREVGKVILLK